MFKKTILKNGLRIITVPQKDTQALTILVLVGTGSKYETKEINGISHFIEHMYFKGTKKRPSTYAFFLVYFNHKIMLIYKFYANFANC